jgi:uncharacterized membrane protein (TIGR02234 family)
VSTVPGRRLPTGGRLLGLIALLLVLAAAALWASSQGTWVSQVVDNPLSGSRANTADGARAEPILVPWALLALAAVGGLVATAVWGRRLVGTLVAIAGGWAVLRAVVGLVAPAVDALPVGLRPGDRALPATAAPVWPLVALLGGLLMMAAGLLAARHAAELPRLGARYDAPGAAPVRRPADPDRALWEAQDEGEDPTRDPGAESGTDSPGSGELPVDGPGRTDEARGLTWNELRRGKGAGPA